MKLKNEENAYHECGLPKYLQLSLSAWKKALAEVETGKKPADLDCDFACLCSDINCAEVDQEITATQANYLRGKYLYG